MREREDDVVIKTVQLGNVIRKQRQQGNLRSVPPPTLYGYLAFVRMARALPHLTLQQVALTTLLGNSSAEDRKHVASVLSEVFGLKAADEDDPTLGGNLF